MEACCSRFTAAEGGTRLAAAASAKNILAVEYSSFISTRLIYENAYKIRGSLFDGQQRSVYVTRASRVPVVSYELRILTDLAIGSAVKYDEVYDWTAELDKKEVLVCTSSVLKQILEEDALSMENINVLVLDSCHLVSTDPDLQYIMNRYKECDTSIQPRILALTYPLFGSPKKEASIDSDSKNKNDSSDYTLPNITEKEESSTETKESEAIDKNDNDSAIDENEKRDDSVEDKDSEASKEVENKTKEMQKKRVDNTEEIGAYVNLDDFEMYEKLEWKIEELEKELNCQMDLAEDIDGGKRISATLTKPKELIIEYCAQPTIDKLPEEYIELQNYMKETINDAMEFIDEHRYDPTEIYGEDLYEEFKNIPDPTLDPRHVFKQFLYVLEQLGPYAADKAAFSLLTKLEKLKIKVPYERHFLLLCLCTSVFVKIRCYADLVFSKFESDWEKIKAFSTPKVLRFAEILEKFEPPEQAKNNVLHNTRHNAENASNNADNKSNSVENESNNADNTSNSAEITSNSAESTSNNTDNTSNSAENISNSADNTSNNSENITDTTEAKTGTISKRDAMLDTLEKCDFKSLSDRIEDKVNIIEANLKEIDDLNIDDSVNNENCDKNCIENENITINKKGKVVDISNEKITSDESKATDDINEINSIENKAANAQTLFKDSRTILGFPRRSGHRSRGRGRVQRNYVSRALQMQQNPDALCGIVFVKEPLMAKILFMVIVDMSRCHPKLSHLCAQYCAVEDPGTEPREYQRQGKKQEEVLKKFRMHECNLLLATSALEEGIDLPRCNLVLRWDVPPSYRSYGLCRGRARAARATCAVLAGGGADALLHNIAVYRELDQIISRKCGCGIQDEPPQSEEDHANSFTRLVKPYTPDEDSNTNTSASGNNCDISDEIVSSSDNNKPNNKNLSINDELLSNNDVDNKKIDEDPAIRTIIKATERDNDNIYCNKCSKLRESVDVECSCVSSDVPASVIVNKEKKSEKKIDNDIASVDLSTAIALINRYCGKLPSDTFTRLAASWTMEEVQLPLRATGERRTAYVCTLRLPLNCPVKYNIVGHPMPTRVLARRMVALQACRILHKSGELDNQLMPIGKENFKAADLEANASNGGSGDGSEHNDSARPGTTKRRQYYYKRTAWAFTDCQPIIDTSDSEIDPPGSAEKTKFEPQPEKDATPGPKRNMLYAIVSTLWCALPERYNTRGRRLHAPQHARQAVAVLMARHSPVPLQIPAFPVYTRSGEVRVSVEYVPDADVRMSPRRDRLVRRFMRFVFAEVLRVRRRGMRLQSDGSTHNNYYIVPTIKTTREDGSTKIDVDWAFLELIYQYTEDKKLSEVEKPILWNQDDEDEEDSSATPSKVPPKDRDKDGKVKKMENPLLKPGETFVFDPEKYREAVVTPWYRNQDQPQFFLVAEICWNLTPDSEFPSDTHKSFRDYYSSKYGVTLTQPDQPLLDVDHTSARLNLLTPRYVNRKGVALPVSSERTRRAKRDRLDQKQILVGELCRVHPFAAPLWFATVALPCVLYRINALLIADEIRRAVAIDVGLGIPQIDDVTCPGFQWPPLDFGWSLAEVLNTDEKGGEKKKVEEDNSKKNEKEIKEKEVKEQKETDDGTAQEEPTEKTLNDIMQKEVDSGFEIGTWSNDMASSIPATEEYDEYMEPLPSNLTFCTSASGGTNWCDPIEKPKSRFNPPRAYSMADSDCSYMSSDFDTDDSDLNSENSDEDTDTSGFCSSKNSNAAMGVRIEYKTAHEAEAVDLERAQKVAPAPQPDPEDDAGDRAKHETYIRSGDPPREYIEKFRQSVEEHKKTIIEKGYLIHKDETINEILPEPTKESQEKTLSDKEIEDLATKLSKVDFKMDDTNRDLFKQVFPYGNDETDKLFSGEQISLESIERNKRILLSELKKSLPKEEIKKLNCFSMVDVDIDSPSYVNEKVVNVGFDTSDSYVEEITTWDKPRKFNPYYMDGKGHGKEFDFDYQPDLEGHPGPSPSVILQALTMSNANDGINLERLETIGDSFLKFAITAYLYCAHPTVHEGKLSHMRSKQVSNLNLYRLGRNKRLGARMIASKFEPHDNWLPPCHRAPATPSPRTIGDNQENGPKTEAPQDNTGCFIPYNLITQHSIPDKSIADCVEALIGAYLLECGPRGALLFMSWLGIKVLPRHTIELPPDHPYVVRQSETAEEEKPQPPPSPKRRPHAISDSDTCSSDESDSESESEGQGDREPWRRDWGWAARPVGSAQPRRRGAVWLQDIYGELKAPPSPLLRYIEDPEGELEQMLSGYDALERTLQYRFKDRSLLLQALTHASHQQNRLTDCYQRLEFLGDAILDYLITRHLYEDPRRHSPGALTDLRSALVNNTIFATLAARHGFHKYFRHMSPGLNEVLTKYVRIQEENGHSISEEHYLIQEDEMEQAEDVEVPKALGDLFESVAGAIFLDSGMSLGAVWASYVRLMGAELEAFSAAAPKSPVRELLEAEPDTAKFGKPERLADGRRVRVCVEVFGRGAFKGVGRNYRIAKGTAARCALRHLRAHRR